MKKCLQLAAVLFLTSIAAAESHPWAQWRGPDGSGVSPEENLPTEWGEGKNLLWKAEISGSGHSSPIVWQDRVFVTAAIQGEQLGEDNAIKHMMGGEEFKHPQWFGSNFSWTFKVFCLDRSSGKVLWEKAAYDGKVYDHINEMGSYAAPTPITDGTGLYVFFGSEGLYRYDLNGNLVWKKSLGGIGTVGMGVGTSPLLYKNSLLLVCDQEFDGKKSFAVALDKNSGEEIWRVHRTQRVTWATPLLVTGNGRDELVVSGAESSVSYDPATGKELWTAPGLVSHAIPSPVSDGKVVFLSAGSQAKHAMAVKLGGSGNLEGTDSILWTYGKGSAYVPSPIYYQGYFYLIGDKGVVTCLEAATGKVVYESRIPESAGIKSSLVAADGKLFASSEAGDTYVLKAGPEFEVLATNSIGEPIWASLAISDGTIFIRGKQHLYAFAGE